jgi:hypothetical protein
VKNLLSPTPLYMSACKVSPPSKMESPLSLLSLQCQALSWEGRNGEVLPQGAEDSEENKLPRSFEDLWEIPGGLPGRSG